MVLVTLNDAAEWGTSTMLMSKTELAFVTIISSRMLWGYQHESLFTAEALEYFCESTLVFCWTQLVCSHRSCVYCHWTLYKYFRNLMFLMTCETHSDLDGILGVLLWRTDIGFVGWYAEQSVLLEQIIHLEYCTFQLCARFSLCWGTCDLQWDLCWPLTDGGISYLVVNCDSLRYFCCGTWNLPLLLDFQVLWGSIKGLLEELCCTLDASVMGGGDRVWHMFATWWAKIFDRFWASPMRGTNISGEIYAKWSHKVITGKISDISLLCKHSEHHVYFNFKVLEFRDNSIFYGFHRIYWHFCKWLAKLLLSYFSDISGITVLALSLGTSWVRN